MKKPMILVSGVVLMAALAWAQASMRAFVNGQPARNAPIQKDGKWYVAVDDLRAAGAEVTVAGNRLSLQFKPMREQMQSDAAEGVIGEWVQNEQWRIRVTDVKPSTNPFGRGPGYAVTLEVRNLKPNRVSFGTVGLRGVDLVDNQGNTLTYGASSFKDLYTSLAQANGFTNTVQFGDRSNRLTVLGKPDRLLFTWGNSGGKTLKAVRIRLNTD